MRHFRITTTSQSSIQQNLMNNVLCYAIIFYVSGALLHLRDSYIQFQVTSFLKAEASFAFQFAFAMS